MPSISACLIVKNEEKDLPVCLDALKPHVDEIIVVDTGSNDNTATIAKEKGASVHNFTWVNDFAKAKNEAIKHANKEWILSIDADEIIAEKDWKKVKELITSNEYDGYFLNQRNYTNNTAIFGWQPCDNYKECKGKGFFNNPLIRLFKNSKDIFFENPVHEVVDKSIEKKRGKIANSNIPIHHYGYLKSDESLNKKREMYLNIGLNQIKADPENPRPYYEVGKIYKNTNEFEKAKEYLEKAASLNPSYRFVFTNLGEVYTKLHNIEKAEESYNKSIELKPNNENAYINLAILKAKQKDPAKAIKLLTQALKVNNKNAAAYNNLAVILLQVQKFTEAAQVLKAAYKETKLEKFKQALISLMKRGNVLTRVQELVGEKKYQGAEELLKDHLSVQENDRVAITNLGMIYNLQARYDEEIALLKEFINKDQPKDKLYFNAFVNLANALEKLNNSQEAAKVLEQAIAKKPPGEEFFKNYLDRIKAKL